MSVTLALGLLLQALALGVVLLGQRHRVTTSLGVMFVGIAILYHGVTEVVQTISPGYSTNRLLTTTDAVADWTVLAGAALLAFAVGYVIPARRTAARTLPSRERTAEFFDWRLLVVLALGVAVATALGRGTRAPRSAVAAVTPDTGGAYLTTGLVAQFLVVGLALGSFAVLVRTNGRGLVPVITAQCALHSLAGQRLPVAMAAVAVLFLLALVGVPVRRRQILAVALLVLLAYLFILGTRQVLGRESFESGVGPVQRVEALAKGAANSGYAADTGGSQELGIRLDGNSYPSIILQRLRQGDAPVGFVTLRNDVALAIPQFLNPGKLDSSIETRSLKTKLSNEYGIDNTHDRLPTQLGELLPVGGAVWMVMFSALGGLALAALERRLVSWSHPAGILALLALCAGVLLYEGGLVTFPLNARGALAVGAVLLCWQKTRELWAGRRAAGEQGCRGPAPTMEKAH